MFVDLISKRLGVANYYAATKFIFNKKNILVDFDYTLDRGEKKVDYLHKFCEKYNLTGKECAAVGDGDSDLPIFKEVGLPLLFIAKETTEYQKQTISRHLYTWKDIYKYL